MVSNSGLEVDKAMIHVIRDLPTPINLRTLRGFLGHAGFYRRTALDAFNDFKEALKQALVLQPPDYNLPFEIMCDASDFAIGALLSQIRDKKPVAIYDASTTLGDAQINYSITEKELLAPVNNYSSSSSRLTSCPACTSGQGCDGSVLLADTPTFTGEQNAFSNRNSIRGMDVIETIKSAVEAACNAIVSCADILALATRDGVVLSGGPSWTVPLGRRDARTASQSAANSNLPLASSSLSTLITSFQNQGLNLRDLVALSGAHTFGLARCVTFRNRIYNDTNIQPAFAATRRATCPQSGGAGDLAPLDVTTPNAFDNAYYINLMSRRGLLHSDQELFNNGSADSIVRGYANNRAAFFRDFVASMVKMGNIAPLTGSNGEIRRVCSRVN
ncbi:peroxidase P7-like [Wolffia australiana]